MAKSPKKPKAREDLNQLAARKARVADRWWTYEELVGLIDRPTD